MDKSSAKEVFFHSCIIGDLSTIKINLFHNISPFSLDKYGNNALHLAAMNNQPKVLEYLLNTVKTYKSNFRNKIGRTALHIAAAQGAFECIEVLLNNFHCDINSTDKIFNNSPLHWCVTSKCIKGVKKLLDVGADFTLVNKFGKTPLQLAKTTCLDIFHLIDNFIKNKNKDQCLHTTPRTNNGIQTKQNISSKSSNTPQFKINNDSSKSNSEIFNKTGERQSINCETILGPNLESNNSDESFYLDISKLKHGDNSVLNLLEKSIEPVDETSFVSSILNSGKVIQLTEAGILALEYTKNEINTPIPDRLVQSFLNTSQQYNENENNLDNDIIEKDIELGSKSSLSKGLKRLKSPQPCSKRLKYTESTITSEFESLLDQLTSKCTKTVPRVYNSKAYCSQSLSSVENSTMRNNEVCNQNQLVCVNPDINAQPKWVDDLMCLLHKLDNSDLGEQKSIELT
ncbi:GA-binding protein subunit beta-1 [Myzus persicae]|uniref:GA-binding protein subunit beta-1 n=1 Tax=Myzus persicae TaxID=13164 RepID=UPI000B939E68|nr:GA-binding protein subunit beta-1 [Myzus persicae]